MVRRFRVAVSSAILMLLTPAAVVWAASPSEQILESARQVLTSAKESKYQHTTHVDEAAGVYDVDCSGFLCFVLKKVSREHYKAVPYPSEHRRPLALQFYEAFTSGSEATQKYWKHIGTVRDARPGDVLVWKRAEQIVGKDTGHVMIIEETPVEDGPNLYRVAVMDSTESPHANDTRAAGSTGVGRGTLWIVTDPQGRPTAYHWKLKKGKPHEIDIAIGRAIEPT